MFIYNVLHIFMYDGYNLVLNVCFTIIADFIFLILKILCICLYIDFFIESFFVKSFILLESTFLPEMIQHLSFVLAVLYFSDMSDFWPIKYLSCQNVAQMWLK